MDENKFEDYLDEVGDDLFYSFKYNLVHNDITYLYCAIVIRKSNLINNGIIFETYEEQETFINKIKYNIEKYENWINGYCYIVHYQNINNNILDNEWWSDIYIIDDAFNLVGSHKKEWTEIENPIIEQYLNLQ